MHRSGVRSAVAFADPEPSGDRWHRGLPGTTLTLILGTADPFLVGGGTRGARSTQRALPSLVGGLQTQGAWTRQRGSWAGVHLALDPLMARRLLAMPAAELAPGADGHTTVDAEAVLPREARHLAEQLATTPPGTEAAVIAAWARARPDTPPARPEVVAACALIRDRHGRIPMSEVARQVHLSARQLRAVVRAELGVGPKHLARLARFERAAGLVADGGRSLSDVAQMTGYADLAHLDAEWRDLVGCPPTVWLAQERRNLQADDGDDGADWVP